MTRDNLQGFIDGYLKAGGDPAKIKESIVDWADKHPIYPLTKAEQAVVAADLESYRGIPKVASVTEIINS